MLAWPALHKLQKYLVWHQHPPEHDGTKQRAKWKKNPPFWNWTGEILFQAGRRWVQFVCKGRTTLLWSQRWQLDASKCCCQSAPCSGTVQACFQKHSWRRKLQGACLKLVLGKKIFQNKNLQNSFSSKHTKQKKRWRSNFSQLKIADRDHGIWGNIRPISKSQWECSNVRVWCTKYSLKFNFAHFKNALREWGMLCGMAHVFHFQLFFAVCLFSFFFDFLSFLFWLPILNLSPCSAKIRPCSFWSHLFETKASN